jgi:16S rRNA (adenine1518-N6/adenine1519-N6)-dimethyltransferase
LPRTVTPKPRQSLGQNFLIDDNIARNIARDLHLTKDNVLLEIGPGRGALTKHLAGKAKHLIAVEIDNRIVDDLRKEYSSADVTVLHQDFLKLDLAEWSKKFRSKIRLVGNIPYHLTSEIIFKAYEARKYVSDLTIMVQREVARRIVARPANKIYGILSVLTAFYGGAEILFTVSPNCFFPKPKVESAVLSIELHDPLPYGVDEKIFVTLVRTAFGKRRKTLQNSLKYLPYSEDQLDRFFSLIPEHLKSRPEQLGIEQFIILTEKISEVIA